MTGVALDPVPMDVMLRFRLLQPLPKIDILDRFFIGCAPPPRFPGRDPAGDAAPEILRVREEIDGARARQRFQRHDRGHQLHPIVGRERFAAA